MSSFVAFRHMLGEEGGGGGGGGGGGVLHHVAVRLSGNNTVW